RSSRRFCSGTSSRHAWRPFTSGARGRVICADGAAMRSPTISSRCAATRPCGAPPSAASENRGAIGASASSSHSPMSRSREREGGAMKIPETGLSEVELFETLGSYRRDDNDWRAGRTFGYVFDAGREIERVGKRAYLEFLSENALDPTI